MSRETETAPPVCGRLLQLDRGSGQCSIQGPGWRAPVAAAPLVCCQLYNTMEARCEWHPVRVDWTRLAETAAGWSVPCRVEIPFVHEVIRFDLTATQRGATPELELCVPFSSVTELDTSLARLLRLDLLPAFGAASAGQDGYLLLPTLAGTLHRFTHRVSREERIGLYGRQEQWAMRSHFNCFGMHHPDRSWCAIVTVGDTDAEVVVRSHFEEDRTYSAHPGLVYRWAPGDPVLAGDRTVRFRLFDPAHGGWAAFAGHYRTFLRAERGVRTWREKAADHPRTRDFAHGFTLKIFQGCKTRDVVGRGQYQSATTFAEARQILERLLAEGMRPLTAQLVGWNWEGHDGRYPSRFPVNPAEGGEAAFRDLIAWGRAHDTIVTVHDNFSDSYEVSPDFSRADAIVLRDGTPWRNIPWCGGFNWRMCPLAGLRHFERDLPRLQALGIAGNYYVDALAAFYPCHSPVHPANRAQMLAGFRTILRRVREAFGTLSLEVAFGPYFDLMDGAYLDADSAWLDNFTPFGRQFVDAVVPFLAVALHNSVRYHFGGQGRAGALRLLAWGGMPFIEVSARPAREAHTMPTYDAVAPFAREAWRLCGEEFADLVEKDLDDVVMLGPDRFRTVFADGTVLRVNASAESAELDGETLPPLSVRRS